jgi:hypothetical protein
MKPLIKKKKESREEGRIRRKLMEAKLQKLLKHVFT